MRHTFWLAVVLLAVFLSVAHADEYDWKGFGTLEAVAVKPFAPTTIDVGAGAGLQITTVPSDWLFIGGRKLFGNAIVLTTGDVAWGGSISLQPASTDDGFRIGACYSSGPGVQVFLAKALKFNW